MLCPKCSRNSVLSNCSGLNLSALFCTKQPRSSSKSTSYIKANRLICFEYRGPGNLLLQACHGERKTLMFDTRIFEVAATAGENVLRFSLSSITFTSLFLRLLLLYKGLLLLHVAQETRNLRTWPDFSHVWMDERGREEKSSVEEEEGHKKLKKSEAPLLPRKHMFNVIGDLKEVLFVAPRPFFFSAVVCVVVMTSNRRGLRLNQLPQLRRLSSSSQLLGFFL